MSTSPSPLRYSGGKAWLAPRVAEWCRAVGAKTLVEPFAGGAIDASHAVLSGAVEHVVLAETYPGVRALWRRVVGP